MKRTCPPPAKWHDIQIGDRVRFQSEAMPVEIEDTIVARTCGMLLTEGGQEILPAHYVIRLGASDPPCDSATELEALCQDLRTLGNTTAADLMLDARSQAERLTERVQELVGDLVEARQRLAPR